MPPRARITKEMIIDAAFEVARASGAETINARTVSQTLGCSTQPVMYHFATIEELKKAAYAKADKYHTEYLLDRKQPQKGIMLGIGLNYIRFAMEEPHLFRFLFQSDFFAGITLSDMINSEELTPVISIMQEALQMNTEQTKEVFVTLALFAHGYASIIANNSLKHDEQLIAAHLEQVYTGAVSAVQEKTK